MARVLCPSRSPSINSRGRTGMPGACVCCWNVVCIDIARVTNAVLLCWLRNARIYLTEFSGSHLHGFFIKLPLRFHYNLLVWGLSQRMSKFRSKKRICISSDASNIYHGEKSVYGLSTLQHVYIKIVRNNVMVENPSLMISTVTIMNFVNWSAKLRSESADLRDADKIQHPSIQNPNNMSPYRHQNRITSSNWQFEHAQKISGRYAK